MSINLPEDTAVGLGKGAVGDLLGLRLLLFLLDLLGGLGLGGDLVGGLSGGSGSLGRGGLDGLNSLLNLGGLGGDRLNGLDGGDFGHDVF